MALLTLTNTKVRNNTAEFGGGIYARDNSFITVTEHSGIYSNQAESGGGVYAYDSTFTLLSGDTLVPEQMQEGVFSNLATAAGGGLYLNRAQVFLTGNLVHPASVSANESHRGSAISSSSSNIIAINSRIDFNILGSTLSFGTQIANNGDPTLFKMG